VPKYRITMTRLVEQEASIYVDARNQEHAAEVAAETACEVADLVWDFSGAEPHTVRVESCELSETADRKVPLEILVPQWSARAERRQVTVMFSDLVG
jgi:hypothetical protein